MARKHQLTNVVVNEVSGVDIPANQHARVTLLKSAGDAIDGISAIRKSLEDSGPEALQQFDAGLQASGDNLAVLLTLGDPEVDEDLSRMAHAFGESVARIFDTTEGAERADHLAETTAQFTAVVANRTSAAQLAAEKAGNPAAGADGAAAGSAPVDKAAAKPGAAKPPWGKRFKVCAECPDEGACTKAGACATESNPRKPAGRLDKAAGDDDGADALAALGEAGSAITKMAATFATINTDRETRQKLMEMTYTLQDSLSSIASDQEVTDKVGMIRQSVAEYDAAVSALVGGGEDDANGNPPVVKKAAGGGAPTQTQGPDMTQDIIKGLTDRLAQVEARDRTAVALAKAHSLLPNGGPVPELAAILEKASAEDATKLEQVVKSLVAHGQAGDLFKAFGAAAGGEGDTVVESGVVKQAREIRKSAEGRGRRAA